MYRGQKVHVFVCVWGGRCRSISGCNYLRGCIIIDEIGTALLYERARAMYDSRHVNMLFQLL